VTRDIGIGLCGTGSWGLNWLRAIERSRGARLVHVCDRSSSALAAASARAPSARASEDPEGLFADPEVDAVVIATPSSTHAELATRALLCGKDVLSEKPLATRVGAAVALAELAASQKAILSVGHLLLFHPAVERLRAIAASGELGELRYLHAQRLNLGVVRADESCWTSLGAHDVAIANAFFEGPPDVVTCAGGAFVRPGGEADVAFATLTYPGGRLAHIHASWLDPNKVRRFTLVGARKMATFDDTVADDKLAIYDRGVEPPPSLAWGDGVRMRTGAVTFPPIPVVEPLVAECEAFVDAVVQRRPSPIVGPRAAVDVVRVLEAGTRSFAAGGAPVRLRDLGDDA
jgi:predicted dehydrogenase